MRITGNSLNNYAYTGVNNQQNKPAFGVSDKFFTWVVGETHVGCHRATYKDQGISDFTIGGAEEIEITPKKIEVLKQALKNPDSAYAKPLKNLAKVMGLDVK